MEKHCENSLDPPLGRYIEEKQQRSRKWSEGSRTKEKKEPSNMSGSESISFSDRLLGITLREDTENEKWISDDEDEEDLIKPKVR